MRARAPGKIVVSGAYSVLYGAPAIVGAVDRWVVADATREAELVGAEVRAAIELGIIERACGVDIRDLFDDVDPARKLGLGSSAAIVASTIAAVRGRALDAAARDELFQHALAAHKRAQPLGSGIDVAASVFGGLVRCQRQDTALRVAPFVLPAPLAIVIYAHPEAASTHDFLTRLRAFETDRPDAFAERMDALRAAATTTADATTREPFLEGLRRQDEALRALDRSAGMGVFVPAFDHLGTAAANEGAFFGPSGAGGGDVGIFVGADRPSARFDDVARSLGVSRLRADVGCGGVTLVGAEER